MTRATLLVLATTLSLLLPGGALAQVKHYPLEAPDGLRLHNVAAEPAVLQDKKGLRVTFSEETVRRFKDMTPEEQAEAQARVGQYAVIEGLEFANGVIEAEIAGAVAPGGAYAGARGFVGIGFRLQNGTYDAFYLRPTNGRAEDQERRNHVTQYVLHPDGRGTGFARSFRPSTNRTSTSCRACGRRSRSTCVANVHVSTSTARSSRR